jgi:hypothetical protein
MAIRLVTGGIAWETTPSTLGPEKLDCSTMAAARDFVPFVSTVARAA